MMAKSIDNGNGSESGAAESCAQANDETEPNSRFEIQTTHGYYPSGRWGHAAWHSNRSKAIARCKEFSRSRVYDHEKEEVIFPTGEDE